MYGLLVKAYPVGGTIQQIVSILIEYRSRKKTMPTCWYAIHMLFIPIKHRSKERNNAHLLVRHTHAILYLVFTDMFIDCTLATVNDTHAIICIPSTFNGQHQSRMCWAIYFPYAHPRTSHMHTQYERYTAQIIVAVPYIILLQCSP